ncbi:uncharacterized protein N7458_012677 [Penicillium daleae]|uniref:DUF3669 domain-containing protein n=1 Tax=Penicillium daleae TaxID=63821 RepID=A0AAD6BUY6_9EURO|nr:uncharacterized protein N7458_012677 [Penicillium daleae]KAJ5433521.1 hypothetical protein N7458_012677 [Penicillium daleae]
MQLQNEADHSEDTTPMLQMIGAGFCGTVWAAPDGGSAYKREDGGPFRSLQNDYDMHRRVIQSIQEFSRLNAFSHTTDPQIQVPHCERFITSKDEDWWVFNLQEFPSEYTSCNILQSQRIPTVPEQTRRLLVQTYCPSQVAEDILSSETNQDCLIRPYLGRRRVWRESCTPAPLRGFSLWNFPLHVDQMDDLHISLEDRQQYSRIMARTLAIMHWVGKIDGNDIEFVLAPPNCNHRRKVDIISNILGEHSVWLLDFDCCRDMSVDEAGVKRAVTAFWRNDPYYPRPIMNPIPWAAFKVEYLETSEVAMGLYDRAEVSKLRGLSKLFIDMVEDQAQARYGNAY